MAMLADKDTGGVMHGYPFLASSFQLLGLVQICLDQWELGVLSSYRHHTLCSQVYETCVAWEQRREGLQRAMVVDRPIRMP